MPKQSKSDVIRALYAAYQQQDRSVAERLIADDFHFTSPWDDEIDRTAYFERCWPTADRIQKMQIERISEGPDGAFVTYKVTANDGSEFHNTEFFRFDGDQVNHVEVFFGATYKQGTFVKAPS